MIFQQAKQTIEKLADDYRQAGESDLERNRLDNKVIGFVRELDLNQEKQNELLCYYCEKRY